MNLFFVSLIEIFLYFFIVFLFRNKSNIKSEELLISNSIYEKNLNESIYGYETNKNLNLLNENMKKLEMYYLKYLNKNYSYESIMNKQFIIKELISNMFYIFSISLGILYIYKGIMSLGEFLLFNSVINYFKEPIKDILDLEPSFIYLKKIYNRINDIIIMRENDDNGLFYNIKSDISFRNLSYKRRNCFLFKGLNFDIQYGSKFMIYGNSGIGKSTIMKILMKYLSEYDGEIFFGSINLKDISSRCILENITYVSQNEFLNNDSFKDNIICGRNIGVEEYENVINICNLEKIRDSNKERNDFLIEENGFNISGGERQKIILAKSILKKSNYYIFDEALSEVGVKEEIEIIKKLFSYLSDKTVIYISHKREIIDLFEKKYKVERRRSYDRRK